MVVPAKCVLHLTAPRRTFRRPSVALGLPKRALQRHQPPVSYQRLRRSGDRAPMENDAEFFACGRERFNQLIAEGQAHTRRPRRFLPPIERAITASAAQQQWRIQRSIIATSQLPTFASTRPFSPPGVPTAISRASPARMISPMPISYDVPLRAIAGWLCWDDRCASPGGCTLRTRGRLIRPLHAS